ncbi:MAG: chemotaxis protein CheW, partial [Candidatus Accumulibacter sp. UW26]
IEPPPSFGARIRADFIQGMGKVAGKFVILLNISRVLSVDEIALLTSVAGEGQGPAPASAV